MYQHLIKRLIDIILSLAGLICLSWLFLLIAIIIKIDDPGPVFFAQKRVGKGKTYFRLYKFRSMKMSTPHDTPTHLLAERDKYGANDIKPGLTGWTQINGRDELEIATKARYDGEYTRVLNEGGFKAFAFDCR